MDHYKENKTSMEGFNINCYPNNQVKNILAGDHKHFYRYKLVSMNINYRGIDLSIIEDAFSHLK